MKPNQKLQGAIQLGLLILVALMPFHAFLSVWLGSITHHQAVIQAWKELLLIVLAGLCVPLLLRDQTARNRLRTWPVKLAGVFGVIALLVTAFARPSLTAVAFGAKTDFEFIVAFVIAIIVATPRFIKRLQAVILIGACLVTAFGLMQIFLLPPDFLTHFGYGPATIAPYLRLDPAISTLRFPATLGGPNQLGTYLVLPLALALILAWRRRQYWWLLLDTGGVIVLFGTHSRSAWLGALAALLIAAITLVPARFRTWLVAGFALTGLITTVVINRLISAGSNLQYYILHGNKLWTSSRGSDFEHLQSLRQGLTASLQQPLGHGLGSSGPSVFHSGTGVIIENYYLQLSYETGLAGLATFAAFAAFACLKLARLAPRLDLAAASLAAIIGIGVTALFLPAWTDSSTALIVWTAAGACLGHAEQSHV